VILVMHAAAMLLPPLAEEHGDLQKTEGQLWHITHDMIEQFIPGFIEGIVPLSQPELSTTSTPTVVKLELPSPNVIQPETATEPVGGTSIV
jgi:hypothetical protein